MDSAADASDYQHRRSDESDTDYDSGDEEAELGLRAKYERCGPTLESDAELSDGDGSDSSWSYNEDDLAAAHEGVEAHFRCSERLGVDPPIGGRGGLFDCRGLFDDYV